MELSSSSPKTFEHVGRVARSGPCTRWVSCCSLAAWAPAGAAALARSPWRWTPALLLGAGRFRQPLCSFSLTVTDSHFLLVTYFLALEATNFIPKCVMFGLPEGSSDAQKGF